MLLCLLSFMTNKMMMMMTMMMNIEDRKIASIICSGTLQNIYDLFFNISDSILTVKMNTFSDVNTVKGIGAKCWFTPHI
jgi:hypothetical protein